MEVGCKVVILEGTGSQIIPPRARGSLTNWRFWVACLFFGGKPKKSNQGLRPFAGLLLHNSGHRYSMPDLKI